MLNSLFNFHYYKTKINPQDYNKEELISSMLDNYSIDSSRNEWNSICDMHHEYNDRGNEKFKNIDYSQLIPLYYSAVNDFISEIKFVDEVYWQFEIQNYTVTSKGQSMVPHHHIPLVFAAVHYLKFDPNEHNSTVFHNPSSYGLLLDFHYSDKRDLFDKNNENNLWMWNDVMVDVEEDDLIIFPAIVNHSIGSSNSEKERVTIALGIDIEKNK